MPESMEFSAETPNPETTPAETHGQSHKSTLAQLFEAYEETPPETAQPETGEDGTPDESPEKGKPKSLKALAETLKLADKDLYAIEIPMASGETRTLGQLKDLVAQQDDFAVSQLEWEETRQQREGDLIRAQNELKELVSLLPKSAIKPEALEAVRQRHEQTMTRERAATLEAIPTWNDDGKRTEEITGMIEHLKGYGFPDSYLTTVADHRVLRYIRENWQRETRIRKALEAVKPATPGKTSKSRPNGAAPKKPSATTGRTNQSRDKLAQLFSLD